MPRLTIPEPDLKPEVVEDLSPKLTDIIGATIQSISYDPYDALKLFFTDGNCLIISAPDDEGLEIYTERVEEVTARITARYVFDNLDKSHRRVMP